MPKKPEWYDSILESMLGGLNPKGKPLAEKVFLETVQGKKDPITERDFDSKALKDLDDLVKIARIPGKVTYADYRRLEKQRHDAGGPLPLGAGPGLAGLSSDMDNLKMTLGRFRYEKTPAGTKIKDDYDFESRGWDKSLTRLLLTHGPYGAIRSYASRKIPPGEGRPVEIQLPDFSVKSGDMTIRKK
jgi:hypothetical protein